MKYNTFSYQAFTLLWILNMYAKCSTHVNEMEINDSSNKIFKTSIKNKTQPI